MWVVSTNSKTADWLCKRDCAAMITTSQSVACPAPDTTTITSSSETDTGFQNHSCPKLHERNLISGYRTSERMPVKRKGPWLKNEKISPKSNVVCICSQSTGRLLYNGSEFFFQSLHDTTMLFEKFGRIYHYSYSNASIIWFSCLVLWSGVRLWIPLLCLIVCLQLWVRACVRACKFIKVLQMYSYIPCHFFNWE